MTGFNEDTLFSVRTKDYDILSYRTGLLAIVSMKQRTIEFVIDETNALYKSLVEYLRISEMPMICKNSKVIVTPVDPMRTYAIGQFLAPSRDANPLMCTCEVQAIFGMLASVVGMAQNDARDATTVETETIEPITLTPTEIEEACEYVLEEVD